MEWQGGIRRADPRPSEHRSDRGCIRLLRQARTSRSRNPHHTFTSTGTLRRMGLPFQVGQMPPGAAIRARHGVCDDERVNRQLHVAWTKLGRSAAGQLRRRPDSGGRRNSRRRCHGSPPCRVPAGWSTPSRDALRQCLELGFASYEFVPQSLRQHRRLNTRRFSHASRFPVDQSSDGSIHRDPSRGAISLPRRPLRR